MKNLQALFRNFIHCHEGTVNKVIHAIGISILLFGVYEKNIWILLLGSIIQESAHFYQYWKTGQLKHSPWSCLKPQLVFAYPLLAIAIVYVLFF